MNRSRVDRCVLVIALASVTLSLLLRVWHRGGNLPRWDYRGSRRARSSTKV